MPAPIGNQNAVKAKRWSAAIDAALAKRSKGDGIKALEQLAEVLLQQAESGDIVALKELGDRIEGKPHQSMDVDLKAEVRDASSLTDDELARRALSASDTTAP